MREPKCHPSRSIWTGLIATALLGLLPGGRCQADPRLSGVVFADYFYNLRGSHVVADDNAFKFRRIYLTAEDDLDGKFSIRTQLEANNDDLTSSGRMSPFVKQAFLKVGRFVPGGDLYLGMSSTPLWQTSEALWGYRSVEKTPYDLAGYGSATDIGAALQGRAGSGEWLGYHVMVSNGSGQRPEANRQKKVMAGFPLRRTSGSTTLTIEPLGEFEGGADSHDEYALKLLVGVEARDQCVLAAEGWRRTEKNNGAAGGDRVPVLLSVYARTAFPQKLNGLLRYDFFDPDTKNEMGRTRTHYVTGGLDYAATPAIHFIPNVWLRKYSVVTPSSIVVPAAAEGVVAAADDPKTDVVARITLAYTWR